MLLYINTANHDFVLDDFSVIKNNSVVTKGIEGIPEIFSNPYRYGYQNYEGNLYRPLPVSIFAIQWSISPDSPLLGHLTNVLFYAISGVLLFLFLVQLLPSKSLMLPFSITALFIAHPIHTEVIANIKSLDELLVFLFSILSMKFLFNYLDVPKNKKANLKYLVLSLLIYFLALLSKESAITLLAVFPLLIFFFSKNDIKQNLKISTAYLIPVLLFFLIRVSIVNEGEMVSLLDNSLVEAESFGERIPSALLFVGTYLWKLLIPYELVSDLGYHQVPLSTFGNWKVILTLLLVTGGLGLAVRSFKKKPLWAFGILFFAITFSVSSNVLLLIGTNYGERLLFLPSLGFVICLAWLLQKLSKHTESKLGILQFIKNNPLYSAILCIILLLYSIQIITRNQDWKSNYSLYSADIMKAPNSARINYQYGLELGKKSSWASIPEESQNLQQEAFKHLQKAVEIYPEYPEALALMGVYYAQNQQFNEALDYYQRALIHNPNDVRLHSNIGKTLAQLDRRSEAKKHFQKAVDLAPNDTKNRYNMGLINLQLGENQAALKQFQAIQNLDPNYPQLQELIQQASILGE